MEVIARRLVRRPALNAVFASLFEYLLVTGVANGNLLDDFSFPLRPMASELLMHNVWFTHIYVNFSSDCAVAMSSRASCHAKMAAE
jgi:hypothetical protein